MAATFGIGVAFEFAAFWALDRVSEAVGLDFNSQVRARVDRFIKMDDAARKDYIKLLNNELEKELEVLYGDVRVWEENMKAAGLWETIGKASPEHKEVERLQQIITDEQLIDPRIGVN